MNSSEKVGYPLFVAMMKKYFIENENMNVTRASVMAERIAKKYAKKLLCKDEPK